MQQAFASIARVSELLEIESRLSDGTRPLRSGALDLELDEVSFAYEQEPVLRDVSLRVAPGRVLGLLGRTASGKSTVARLLLRRHDPASGAVRPGGVDLLQAALPALGAA